MFRIVPNCFYKVKGLYIQGTLCGALVNYSHKLRNVFMNVPNCPKLFLQGEGIVYPRDIMRGSCQLLTQIEKCIHECPKLSQIVSVRWRDCISKGHHVGFNQSSSSGFPPSTPRWFINLVRRTTLKSFLTGFNHYLNFFKAAHLSCGQEQLWNLSHSFEADSIFKADRIYLFH